MTHAKIVVTEEWQQATEEQVEALLDGDNGMFHVPPACQGQTVQRAYCLAGEVLVRRTTDRSDGARLHAVRAWREGDDPINDEPQ